MNALSSISLSGMNAAQTRLQSSAHNVANLNTEGFKRQEVAQSALAEGGTRAQVAQASTEGASLESDMVGQLQAKNSFLANLAVFKTGNAMLGALLDQKA